MAEEKLNLRFDIPLDRIQDAIGMRVNGELSGYDRVVSPRDVKSVDSLVAFRTNVLEALIRRIPLRGTDHLPYADSVIKVFRREPKGVDVGQNFLLDRKTLSIMHGLERGVFRGF